MRIFLVNNSCFSYILKISMNEVEKMEDILIFILDLIHVNGYEHFINVNNFNMFVHEKRKCIFFLHRENIERSKRKITHLVKPTKRKHTLTQPTGIGRKGSFVT